MNNAARIRWIAKPIVHLACLGPFAWLVWLVFAGGLGANPADYMNRFLGDWALRFLLIALAVTPIRGLTGWGIVMVFRRIIGLYAFFYVSLHLTSYIVVDQTLDWPAIWADIVKRQYITVGMITFALLLPLAITSTNGMVRRLGAKRWRKLHRAVYVAGVGGVFHFFMMTKADYREPTIYAATLAFLLGYRIYVARKRRKPKKASATP